MSSVLTAGNAEENAERGGCRLMDGFDDGGGPCPNWGGRRGGGRVASPFVLGMLVGEGICVRMVGATVSTIGEVIAGVGRADGIGELLLSVMGSRDSE